LRRRLYGSVRTSRRSGAFGFSTTRSEVNLRRGNRYRFWGQIEELEGRILRVITLEDKVTIHNAFPDRGFKP
jgi:hypothetical protein